MYGNDLNEDIGPIEAGLTWTIGKSRREKCDFVGGDVIKQQLADGVPRRRVGLHVGKGAPARGGSKILDMDGNQVGEVTSGGFSPVLGSNIAMGYVQKALAKVREGERWRKIALAAVFAFVCFRFKDRVVFSVAKK